MATQGYKAVFVKDETHKRLKILAVTKGMTFDEMVEQLMNFNEANSEV